MRNLYNVLIPFVDSLISFSILPYFRILIYFIRFSPYKKAAWVSQAVFLLIIRQAPFSYPVPIDIKDFPLGISIFQTVFDFFQDAAKFP